MRLAVERHKTRLHAELAKVRLKRGFTSIKDLQAHIEAGKLQKEDTRNGNTAVDDDRAQLESENWPHPRWVRINVLKTNLREQMRTTFADCKIVESIEELLMGVKEFKERFIYVDQHVPNLVALSSASNLAKTPAYLSGLIILQDKASCFPAYLLDPDPRDGHILDACAAPGNKATHLAAMMQEKGSDAQAMSIYACERDKARAITLRQMVHRASASRLVTIKEGQDFLRLHPEQAPWNGIGALLLDPSCSGSGIVGRDEMIKFVLPGKPNYEASKQQSKKRKRKGVSELNPGRQELQEEVPMSEDRPANQLADRLSALSEIQLKLLLHAFRFPKTRRITYSTCSIYAEENEHVVVKALNSLIARTHGWRILPRDQQVSGMKTWHIRGDLQACAAAVQDGQEIAEACIRCEKDTKEGTQGFFVAAFVRTGQGGEEDQFTDEEWEGFTDDGTTEI